MAAQRHIGRTDGPEQLWRGRGGALCASGIMGRQTSAVFLIPVIIYSSSAVIFLRAVFSASFHYYYYYYHHSFVVFLLVLFACATILCDE